MKKAKSLLLVTALLGSAFLGGGTSWAADPVIVNVDAENPPFMFASGGKPAGVYPAVISAAFAKMNVPLKLEAKPWKRVISEIDEGKAGVGGIYKNDERAKKYDYSGPIISENLAVYSHKDKPIEYKAIADLHGKKVGVIAGWSYGDEFDAAKKGGKITVEEVTNDEKNLRKLEEGRLDAVIAVEDAAKPIISSRKLGNIVQAKQLLASNKSYLAFNKSTNQTALLDQFSKTIAAMRDDGSLDKIVVEALAGK